MKLLCEKPVHTKEFAGTIDLLTGYDDFNSEIEFNEEWHTYKLKGKLLISVTQLLDDGTYDNVDKDILKYAQDKGTIVHKEIQNYLEGNLEGFTEEFYEFVRLYQENIKLFSNRAIFDYKTYSIATPANRKKCWEQTSKYADGVEYLTGIRPEKQYLIHLPHGKSGKIYDLTKEFGGS